MDRPMILFAFYPLPPLRVKWNHGIALLSALCEERGIRTFLYVLDAPERFRETVRSYPGQYVGFSCVTEHDYLGALPFMAVAKQEGKTVLLGGVYPRRGWTIDAPADFICRGDGEDLPEFLLYGNTRCFEEPRICGDLNALPLPNYEMFKHIPFDRKHPILKGKVLPYVSSRGCPYRCPFCESAGQSKTLRIRYKVEEDLTQLRDAYRPDMFYFGDELFPYYSEAWRDSWGDFRHPFSALIRADISPVILEWLIDRGLAGCAFGIESGDEAYRNTVLGKKLTDAQIFQTVEILKKRGVQYVPFYMTDTPGETWAIKTKTLKMSRQIGGYPYFWQYENVSGGDIWVQ